MYSTAQLRAHLHVLANGCCAQRSEVCFTAFTPLTSSVHTVRMERWGDAAMLSTQFVLALQNDMRPIEANLGNRECKR